MSTDLDVESTPVVAVSHPLVPRVNLLPPSIAEAGRLRAVQGCAAGGVLAAAAVVAVAGWAAAGHVDDARAQFHSAQAARVAVDAQVAELVPVRAVYAQIEAAEAVVASARVNEVAWSRLLNDLSLEVPHGVWVETMSVTPPTAGTGGTSGPGGLGVITYTGRGRDHGDVATWVETLESHPGLVDATFSASTVDSSLGEKTVTFSTTVNVAPEALRNGTQG